MLKEVIKIINHIHAGIRSEFQVPYENISVTFESVENGLSWLFSIRAISTNHYAYTVNHTLLSDELNETTGFAYDVLISNVIKEMNNGLLNNPVKYYE